MLGSVGADFWRSSLAANSLASLAGLLAGITFAAIVLVLQTTARKDPRKRPTLTDAVRVLVISFASLTMAALLYAIEYGWSTYGSAPGQDPRDPPAVRYIHAVASTVFAAGALALFIAVGLLLRAHDMPGVAGTTRKVGMLLGVLAVMQVDQGYQDMLTQLGPTTLPLNGLAWVGSLQ